jgi:hypothetical protein
MSYSSVYGFNVTDAIRKGKNLLLIDLEEETVLKAANVSAALLIEAIDDKTGRYVFYEKENDDEQQDKSSKNPEQTCNDAHISGISEC